MISEKYNEPGISLDYSVGGYAMLDQFGRVQYQEWTDNAGSNLLDGYEYWYDQSGNVTMTANLTMPGGPAAKRTKYGYWSTDRLWYEQQRSQYPDVGNYDSAGNMIYTWDAQSGQYVGTNYVNAANELFFLGDSAAASYDAAGNMTAFEEPGTGNGSPAAGAAETATWDAWGRMATVTIPLNAQGGTTTVTYSYDGAGRCISTLVVASTAADPTPISTATDNYYAGQQVIQTDSAGSPQYQYVWSPLGSNSLILRGRHQRRHRAALLPRRRERQRHLAGTVQRHRQRRGRLSSTILMMPTGTSRSATRAGPRSSNASAYGNTILFAGCQLDANTGLYLMGAQVVRPGPGPLHQPRPGGLRRQPAESLHLLQRQPVEPTDPSGMDPTSAMGAAKLYGRARDPSSGVLRRRRL